MEINKIASANSIKTAINASGSANLSKKQITPTRAADASQVAVHRKMPTPAVQRTIRSASRLTKTEAGKVLKKISSKIRNLSKTNVGKALSQDKLQRVRMSIARQSSHVNITRSAVSGRINRNNEEMGPATTYQPDSPIAMSSEAPTGSTLETPDVYIEFVDGVMLKITRKPYQQPVVEVEFDPSEQGAVTGQETVAPDVGSQVVQMVLGSGVEEDLGSDFEFDFGTESTYRESIESKDIKAQIRENDPWAKEELPNEEIEFVYPGFENNDGEEYFKSDEEFVFTFAQKDDAEGELLPGEKKIEITSGKDLAEALKYFLDEDEINEMLGIVE